MKHAIIGFVGKQDPLNEDNSFGPFLLGVEALVRGEIPPEADIRVVCLFSEGNSARVDAGKVNPDLQRDRSDLLVETFRNGFAHVPPLSAEALEIDANPSDPHELAAALMGHPAIRALRDEPNLTVHSLKASGTPAMREILVLLQVADYFGSGRMRAWYRPDRGSTLREEPPPLAVELLAGRTFVFALTRGEVATAQAQLALLQAPRPKQFQPLVDAMTAYFHQDYSGAYGTMQRWDFRTLPTLKPWRAAAIKLLDDLKSDQLKGDRARLLDLWNIAQRTDARGAVLAFATSQELLLRALIRELQPDHQILDGDVEFEPLFRVVKALWDKSVPDENNLKETALRTASAHRLRKLRNDLIHRAKRADAGDKAAALDEITHLLKTFFGTLGDQAPFAASPTDNPFSQEQLAQFAEKLRHVTI